MRINDSEIQQVNGGFVANLEEISGYQLNVNAHHLIGNLGVVATRIGNPGNVPNEAASETLNASGINGLIPIP